jgi:hypothetical protein
VQCRAAHGAEDHDRSVITGDHDGLPPSGALYPLPEVPFELLEWYGLHYQTVLYSAQNSYLRAVGMGWHPGHDEPLKAADRRRPTKQATCRFEDLAGLKNR